MKHCYKEDIGEYLLACERVGSGSTQFSFGQDSEFCAASKDHYGVYEMTGYRQIQCIGQAGFGIEAFRVVIPDD